MPILGLIVIIAGYIVIYYNHKKKKQAEEYQKSHPVKDNKEALKRANAEIEQKSLKTQERIEKNGGGIKEVTTHTNGSSSRLSPELEREKEAVESGQPIQHVQPFNSHMNDEPTNNPELTDEERNKQARKEAWDKLMKPKPKKPHYVRNTMMFGILGTIHSSHVDKKNKKR